MAELQLIRFVGGLGNRNHDHVHRHNMLNLESRDADLLKTEDYSGGILPSTLAGLLIVQAVMLADLLGLLILKMGGTSVVVSRV